MKLYTFSRSSASFRVRIALNLKGLSCESVPIHLTRGGGEQHSAAFRSVNPQALVPVLEDAGHMLYQSLAIIEYLEETHPAPALLPAAPADRARVRALALSIACEIHPLNNLRVLGYLTKTLNVDDDQKKAWYRHWVEQGLAQMEEQLSADQATGRFCHGDAPTLADCCLVPQIFNAKRFDCNLTHVPTVMRIFDACMAVDAFETASPEHHPEPA
ncbi:MAG: maiA [Herminiimonas sp.]|nr:maiA [Herminiimonas sp.]